MRQSAVLAIVIENFGVAAPVHRGFELALDFVFGEMLVENVVEEFVGDGVIGLALQDAIV